MGTRIPLRIYRIKSGPLSNPTVAALQSTDYLQGLTANDISFLTTPPTIQVSPANLPGNLANTLSGTTIPSTPRPYAVRFDYQTGLYFTSIPWGGDNSVPVGLGSTATKNLYIRSPQLTVIPTANLPIVFQFYVNPARLTPTYKKIVTETRTRGGFEIQHWGEQLTELHVEGKSGGLHRDAAARPSAGAKSGGQTLPNYSQSAGIPVMQSTAWQRLTQLKQLYDADHAIKNQSDSSLLGLNYYDKFFVGYFTEFTGPSADAMDPNQVSYSFTFKVQREGFGLPDTRTVQTV